MKHYIATATVNGNEVKLVKEDQGYFIYWGVPLGTQQSKTELLTPSGRVPSQSSACKKFLQAVEAAQYLKFEKL
jgi:hypothetical protein